MGSASSANQAVSTNPQLPTGPVKSVDSRLPFTHYKQVFTLKNNWKAVSRRMDEVSKDCLSRFFMAHPHHLQLHSELAKMDKSTLESSIEFENSALNVFQCIDEVVKKLEEDVDSAIAVLEKTGKFHKGIDGFEASYFQDMENPFVDSIKDCLGERCTEATDGLLHNFYAFLVTYLSKPFER